MSDQQRGRAEEVRRCLEALSADERRLLASVILAEREKLHMTLPRGIKDDIWKAVTETVK